MTTTDIYLTNAVVYNLQDRIGLRLGEKATLVLNEYTNEQVFSNNDKVLDLDQADGSLVVKASQAGTSMLLFMAGDMIVKKLQVDVAETISLPAISLGVSVGEPVIK